MPQSCHRARAAAGGKVLGAVEPPSRSPNSGQIRGGVMKDVISLRRFMPGSPKALTPPT